MSKVKTKESTPIEIVGRTLSREAKLLSRVVAPSDQPVTMAISKALRDPERVARLIEGLLPDDKRRIPA